ncbi:MAG TPA: outer membrane protein assembly factor BamD, partial [Tepidisphaeraceae bacterium]|nr:outer membrane protein assembly factor BamD [Tepidisphaeraceae bacterium]
MGRIPALVAIVAASAVSTAVATLAAEEAFAHQPTSQTWELKGKEWQPAAGSAVDPSQVGDPTLDEIEGLIERGRGKDAFKKAVVWLNGNSGSPSRDRGLYLAARSLYISGNKVKSFYYCDELMDLFTESAYFQPALELQYQIADGYLGGEKRRVLGLPLDDYSDEAIEMLFRIQVRSPGSQLAERALLRSADYYYSKSDYDLAGDAYAAYVRSYPRSPDIARIRLRQAWSYLAQFRGPRFDATPIVNAKSQLTDLIATYPELAQEENLGQLVDRIDSTIAQKFLTTAS